MGNEEQKEAMYCGSYSYQGKTFTWYLEALSFEDANARMRAIGETGRVDGQLHQVIDATDTSNGMNAFLRSMQEEVG